MSSLRATICAASVVTLGLVAPLSAVADTSTSLKPLSVNPSASVAATNGSAAVKLDGCTLTGSSGRSASFSSKMVAGSSAASIELRFDLFTRPIAGGSWKAVTGVPMFGSWDRPSSSSVVWSKRVGGLTVGQSYRVLVTHRWLSKSGRVIRRNVIASPACDQHDARADLAASFVGVKPLANGNKLYTLLVRNIGLSAASGFSVSMRVNRIELPTVRVASLGAGKSRLVTFTAAGCASGSNMNFEADFSKELAEPNEANNVAEIACPVVGG
jgi:CARDB